MNLSKHFQFFVDLFLFRSYNTCHDASVVACAFTPDSTFIISGSSNGDLRVWDAKYGHGKVFTYTLEGHDLGVTSCDFSPHMKVKDSGVSGCVTYEFATSGHDNLVKIWEMTADLSCTCKSLYKPFFGELSSQVFSPFELSSLYCPQNQWQILLQKWNTYIIVLWRMSIWQLHNFQY